MARVSVVIPVFNNAATLSLAIDSALAQKFGEDFEVIAVNDGSTDGSAEILERYAYRIRIIAQENRGPAAARNLGVTIARGEYIAFLDADDEFLPGKLAATVPILDRMASVVLVFHDAIPVSRTGQQAGESYVSPTTAHAPSMVEMLDRWWPILPSTAVIRRRTFEACGGFVEEFRAAAYEDPYLWLVAREHGEFQYVPERLTRYTVEPEDARMEKYLHAQKLFIRLVEARYGKAARALIRSTAHSYANALTHQGLSALRLGDRLSARRYFMRALRDDPDARTVLRMLRTFLPLRLARALSGKTAGQMPDATSSRINR